MPKPDPIVIVGAARTPIGGFQGDLSGLAAPELGAAAIRAAVERAGIPATEVDEVLFGCVLPAGQGQAPARQAALGAGLPLSAGATTVNKMCGSGMKAVMLAHDLLLAGSAQHHRRRRHGEHEQRALSPRPRALRLSHGPPAHSRSHVSRRPGRRLRQRPADGHVRRRLRAKLRLHARGARRIRPHLARPRAKGYGRGRFCVRNYPAHSKSGQNRAA